MRGKLFSKVGRTVAVSLVALLCSFAFVMEFNYLPADADEDIVVQVVAHRGYSGAYPENTLSAFAGAYAHGAKTVEFDVRKTKDGELVIYHDDTLEKVDGGETPTRSFWSLMQVRGMTRNTQKSEFLHWIRC